MTSLNRPDDELANLTTHGVALLVSLVAAAHLMFTVADRSARFSLLLCRLLVFADSCLWSVNAFTSVLRSELASTFSDIGSSEHFHVIAGTYTPLSVKYLNHGWWPLILIAMWVLAFAGAIRVFQIGDLPRMDKAVWIARNFSAVTLGELFANRPLPWCFGSSLRGPVMDSAAPFLRFGASRRFAHAIWHLFVVVGATPATIGRFFWRYQTAKRPRSIVIIGRWRNSSD